MLNNKKRTFELLDELICGGDRIIVEVAGKDLEQANWFASIAVNHLNTLDEDAEYIYYHDCLHSNILTYWYEIEDGCGEYLDFMLIQEWSTCTKPYYSLRIWVYGDDIDEDNLVRYHKIYRRSGNDGKWQPGPMHESYTQQGRGKCATCPRYHLCAIELED